MNLLIVESPVKGKTIGKFLGQKYKVLSSYGHIRDLPKSELGIDIEQDFKPKYIIPLKARKTVNFLKKETQKAQLIILAVDSDREGEAVAWHLTQVLQLGKFQGLNSKSQTDSKFSPATNFVSQNLGGQEIQNLKPYQRIVFHEITKSAIDEALKNPKEIDINLVDAQQARRILDRIVGYKLSPFLWKKVTRGLSAGRVQSVVVKLVCEREKEIEKFTFQEYWTIVATLLKIKNNEFETILTKKDGKTLDKLAIKTKKEAEEIIKDLEKAEYKIIAVSKKEIKRNPLPPFTTSTLQQESWKRLHWSAKNTMRIAQQLYEKGLTTYHRTDSLNLSDQSLLMTKKFICEKYGQNYWTGYLKKYKTKTKSAQEAHEAIRPSYPNKTPEILNLEVQQLKLYQLIWQRFIACQMAQAVFDSTSVEIEAKNYTFKATGQVLKFDGFLKIYPIKYEENELPLLEKNEILKLLKLISIQHFTQPPSRHTEASLIKILEENGIGRPSTYAPILFAVQERNYIEKNEQKRFQPTEIGIVVNDLLVAHFPKIVDIGFTAEMEENLDKIAQGSKKWISIIKEFYQPFEKNLKQKETELSKQEIAEEKTDKVCPKCSSSLIIKLGRFGKFYACSKFPECRYTESLKNNKLNIKCFKCNQGEIVEKRTKKKKIFYGCDQFPICDFALWDKPTGEKCPKCKSPLIKAKGGQIKCSNKKCDSKIEK